MSKEAMKLALKALKTERDNYLEYDVEDGAPEYIYEAITALEFEVAKQEQDGSLINEGTKSKQEQGEPVAWMYKDSHVSLKDRVIGDDGIRFTVCLQEAQNESEKGSIQPLYTTPPQQRKLLTDEEIKDVANSCMWWVREQDILDDAIEFARAIEAAHGIKSGTDVKE